MSTLPLFFSASSEVLVFIAVLCILLFGVNARSLRTNYYLAQLGLLSAAIVLIFSFQSTSIAPQYLFHKMFVFGRFSLLLKFLILLTTSAVLIYSREYNADRNIAQPEFYALALLSVLGMLVLVSAQNILVVYLGLELFSLPSYAMVALQRNKGRCIEASMKYFVTGAIASGLLLYGISLIFGATLHLDLSDIAKAIPVLTHYKIHLALFGLAFVMAGIIFKLGAAPFHMWVPDVYDGAPTSVTLFLSTAPKLAAFALLTRLLFNGLPGLGHEWQAMLIIVAISSMALGNLVAIVQTNIKRMLAYSSIAHMGYMLLGFLADTTRGETAALFYMIAYTIMTLGAFGIVTLMSRVDYEVLEIEDFAGLGNRHPWLAFMMLLIMFSMAGVPPIIGFIAKVGVLEALIEVHLVWLAVVALLFAVIGAYYYLRVVKVMYFDQMPKDSVPIRFPKDAGLMISINGIGVLVLGLLPGVLFALCHSVF